MIHFLTILTKIILLVYKKLKITLRNGLLHHYRPYSPCVTKAHFDWVSLVFFKRWNASFLGSGADFPVGNVSIFKFFSGHVAESVIVLLDRLDMRQMQRWELTSTFDVLNVLQAVRLLAGAKLHPCCPSTI